MPFDSDSARKAGQKSSRKGTSNNDLQAIRLAYQNLIEDKLPHIDRWLDEVAQENPSKALDLMIRLSEFCIPKLQRTTYQEETTTEPFVITIERVGKCNDCSKSLDEADQIIGDI